MVPTSDIDILENTLRRRGDLLDMLLLDRTTGKNILWGTDSYVGKGKEFAPDNNMKPELVTGVYGKLIQPRAIKSREDQLRRTKVKGEVFTPLTIVQKMNGFIDQLLGENRVNAQTWQDYVGQLHLEITCGEAPFIVTRYNPVAHGALLKLENRVGFLDRKLRMVSHYCSKPKEWLKWAKVAFQSSYGYEWQGDNLLIARENLLYSLIDYYVAKFGRSPSLAVQQEFAEVISWNIFQMDGTKYVIPMSCHHETHITPGDLTLFGELPAVIESYECEGCKFNRPAMHNGKYAKIIDWHTGRSLRFIEISEQY
jgi:type II restriction enzyme